MSLEISPWETSENLRTSMGNAPLGGEKMKIWNCNLPNGYWWAASGSETIPGLSKDCEVLPTIYPISPTGVFEQGSIPAQIPQFYFYYLSICVYIHLYMYMYIKGGACCERLFFAFLKTIFCKRYPAVFFAKPNVVVSATIATTVQSQLLSRAIHRYIPKTNMNSR